MGNNETFLRKLKQDVRNKSIAIDYLDAKMSIKDIAEKYKLSKYTIYQILYTYKVEIVKQRSTKEMYDNIAAEYKDGKELEELATKYNVSILTIYRALRMTNTPTRKPPLTKMQQEIVDRLQRGEKQVDIAKRFHCTRQYINKVSSKFVKGNK